MKASGQYHTPATLHLDENPGNHFIGDMVGTRDGLGALEKRRLSRHWQDSNPNFPPASPDIYCVLRPLQARSISNPQPTAQDSSTSLTKHLRHNRYN
jgi:hypothetical protein